MVYVLNDIKSALGTFVNITVIHPELETGARALRAAFTEIFRIQNLMNIHQPESEVSRLNRDGGCTGLSQDTQYVIQRSVYYSALSGGAFDITILPILRLWADHARRHTAPTEKEINRKLGVIGYKNLIMDNGGVRFARAGMKLTLAGVAKGYAIDKAVETLKKHHIKNALVNAGGDIRCIGGKSDNIPWRIGVRDPFNNRRLSTTVELKDKAIATSGFYRKSFNDIVDPASGRPSGKGILSSSVVTDTAIDADILTKCLFVLGIEKVGGMLRTLGSAEAMVITSDGRIVKLP